MKNKMISLLLSLNLFWVSINPTVGNSQSSTLATENSTPPNRRLSSWLLQQVVPWITGVENDPLYLPPLNTEYCYQAFEDDNFQVDARFSKSFSSQPQIITLNIQLTALADPGDSFDENYHLKLVNKPCTKTMTIPLKFENLRKIILTMNLFVGINQGYISNFETIILPGYEGRRIIMVDGNQIATVHADLRPDLNQLNSIPPISVTTALAGLSEKFFKHDYLCGVNLWNKFVIKPHFTSHREPIKYSQMVVRQYQDGVPGAVNVIPVWPCESSTKISKTRRLVLSQYDDKTKLVYSLVSIDDQHSSVSVVPFERISTIQHQFTTPDFEPIDISQHDGSLNNNTYLFLTDYRLGYSHGCADGDLTFYYALSHNSQHGRRSYPFALHRTVDIIPDPKLTVSVNVKEFDGNKCDK